MSEILNFFPLSIFKDTIKTSEKNKQIMIDEILKMEESSKNESNEKAKTWTGDTRGHEFLFKNKNFELLFIDIGNKIKEYIESLSLNSSELNFYFQRAWATVTKNQGNIKPHRHNQSHISFAYYLSLPKDSGAIVFLDDDPANQIAPGLFRSKLVRKPSLLNAPEVTIEAKENDIIIFPSKTRHTTKSNQTNKIRISISADIVITLKNSKSYERLMPDFSILKRF